MLMTQHYYTVKKKKQPHLPQQKLIFRFYKDLLIFKSAVRLRCTIIKIDELFPAQK